MNWVLYMIGILALLGIWDVDSKLKKLLRAQNTEGSDNKGSAAGTALSLESLIGKKVRIFLDDDCEIQDCIYFMGKDAVTGEIIGCDDTWAAFRYTAPRYEKVPERTEDSNEFKTVPVKGATVTQYLRISDIASIDEVTDEN